EDVPGALDVDPEEQQRVRRPVLGVSGEVKHLGTPGQPAPERVAVEDVTGHPLEPFGGGGSFARRTRQPPYGSPPSQEGRHEPVTDEARTARDEDPSGAQGASNPLNARRLRRHLSFTKPMLALTLGSCSLGGVVGSP